MIVTFPKSNYWNYFLIGQIIFLDYGAESIRDYLKPLRYIPSHFEKLFCVFTFECDSVLISYFTCSYQSKQVFQEKKILIHFLQNYQKNKEIDIDKNKLYNI